MKIKINETLFKIIISTILFVLALFFKDYSIYVAFLVISYLVVSFDVFKEGVKKLFHGEVFDESTLMIIATISAFIIGEYPEAVMVMLLFEFGEYLSDLATSNSKKSITKLMDLRSDYVNLKENNGIQKVDVREVKVGDIFVVKPGEKVPLDGIIQEGSTFLDTSSLTGESVLREAGVFDKVLSGYVNESGVITVKATSVFASSTASKIINMLENSMEKKTNTEKFITRFSKIYTPVVVVLAILIVIIPVMFGGNFNDWLYKALVFLVTACPCALVISVPLGFFCGIGRSSKEGVLVKGSDGLEKLSKLEAILFDKTGTITEGKFAVQEIVSNEVSQDELLKLAAYGEYYSNHPIARTITQAYDKSIDEESIKNFKEISGYGITATVLDKKLIIGNEKLFDQEKISVPSVDTLGTTIYIAYDGKYIGYIVTGDKIKTSALNLVDRLKYEGINRIVMLSGDNKDVVSKVASKTGIKEYYASLLPADKVAILEKIKKDKLTAFVGDGINECTSYKTS